jgi:hypothetical protein
MADRAQPNSATQTEKTSGLIAALSNYRNKLLRTHGTEGAAKLN